MCVSEFLQQESSLYLMTCSLENSHYASDFVKSEISCGQAGNVPVCNKVFLF